MNNNLILKMLMLSDTMKIPTQAHSTDACFDIYSDLKDENKTIEIQPFEYALIPTGFATEIPEGYWCPIYARSGLSTKEGLRLCQGTAVIDEDYRGEWFIPLYNQSKEVRTVKHNEKICQFHLQKKYPTEIKIVDELGETERGSGGFNSTGKF